jgi:hypothetical protein
MILGPIRTAIAPYLTAIKLTGAVLLLAFVAYRGYDAGRDKWQGKFDAEAAAHVATKQAHAVVLRDLANKTKAAEAAAKAASLQAKTDRKANDDRYKEATREATQARNALARALRSGDVRLRPEWACDSPRPAEGGTAGFAGRQDAGADLRAAGAADLVAAGDAADNWITWLQSEVTSTRKACGVVP